MTPKKSLSMFFTLLTLLICNRAVDCQPRKLTAKSIVEKMAAQLANASSYQDSGVVVEVDAESDKQLETVIRFKTSFVRPQLFRFEWRDLHSITSEERLNVVWNDGKQTYSFHSWDDRAVKKEENIALGVAGATGISSGSAHTILVLLMEEVGGFRLTEMTKLSLLGAENFEGEDCYIVRGYHPHNLPIDMWISKRDFLLRKTKHAQRGGVSQVEIRRGVRLNEEIPSETFNFTPPPPPKDKSRPRYVASRT